MSRDGLREMRSIGENAPMDRSSPINPARVDFLTLRLFCAVAKAGSITKGAEVCGLALSAASRRLSEFESAAGSTLLHRTPRGIVLTSPGHVALQHAVRLFQGFEQLGSELKEHARGARGHVRLWANMSALTEFLPAALASFLEGHPDIRVDVEEQLSGDIVRAVFDGLADIGVFADGTPAHGLNVKPFQLDELVLVCSREHELARRRRVSFDECLNHDFVGLNRGSSLLELISREAQQRNRPLRLRVQVRSFDAMTQMISAGLGIGVLPLAACESALAARRLKALRLDEPWAQRRLLIATRAETTLTPAAALFLQHLQRVGASAPT